MVVTDNVLGVVGTVAGPVAPGATNYLYATNLNMTLNVTNVGFVVGDAEHGGRDAAAGHPAGD